MLYLFLDSGQTNSIDNNLPFFAVPANIKIVTFDDIIKKYNINEIEYLFIDTEGYDYQIIRSINFNKIKINRIKFEYKHLDDTFKFEKRLSELREMFRQLNFKETGLQM